jgi:hypothetical protein
MKTDHDSFPFATMTFIFILFLNLGFLLFEKEKGAFIAIHFLMFLTVLMVTGLMAYHKRDLPVVILPVTIFLLGVGMPLFEKQEDRIMVQINFLDATAAALIGGICGILGTALITLWKTWKDSKTIDSVKECAGDIKAEVISARGRELKNIESHTSDINKNMLSKVIPGIEKLNKLDNISEFVTRIDANTNNDGGNVPLILSEVNKMVEKMNSFKDELEAEKKESREKDQKYLGQISALRMENEQLKQRNKKLEYLQRGRGYNRDQELEP